MKMISHTTIGLSRVGILKSSMLAISTIAIIGCGGGNISSSNKDIELSQSSIGTPVLRGFSTAVPVNIKPNDAVGNIYSAFSEQKSRTYLGNMHYTISGKDADKFTIDQDGFIRATQALNGNATYKIEIRGESKSTSTNTISVQITSGSLLKSIANRHYAGNSTCPSYSFPSLSNIWIPKIPEGSTEVTEIALGDSNTMGVEIVENFRDSKFFNIERKDDGKLYLVFDPVAFDATGGTPDYENPLDEQNDISAGKNNDYKVRLKFSFLPGHDSDQTEAECFHDMCVRITDVEPEKEPCPIWTNAVHINENKTYIMETFNDSEIPMTISGADASFFTYDPLTGELAFNAAPDFETPSDNGADNIYEISLSDGDQAKQNISVHIDNVPDTPPILEGFGATIGETTPVGTLVGTVNVANPAVQEDHIQFMTLVDPVNSTMDFYIDIDGNVYVNRPLNAPVDETVHYNLSAYAYNESGWSPEENVFIDVIGELTDVPTLIPHLADVYENSAVGTQVGDFMSPNFVADTGSDAITAYSLWEPAPAEDPYQPQNFIPYTGPFQIDNSGKITVKTDVLDYETQVNYKLWISATNGAGESKKTCAYVTVKDIDENNPLFLAQDPILKIIPENTTGVLDAITYDETTPVTYSIEGGADAALFSIDPNNGALNFIHAPDYENPQDAGNDNTYDLIIRATDSVPSTSPYEGPYTTDKNVKVMVTNIPDVVPVIQDKIGPLAYNLDGDAVDATVKIINEDELDAPITAFTITSALKTYDASWETGGGPLLTPEDATDVFKIEMRSELDGTNVYTRGHIVSNVGTVPTGIYQLTGRVTTSDGTTTLTSAEGTVEIKVQTP